MKFALPPLSTSPTWAEKPCDEGPSGGRAPQAGRLSERARCWFRRIVLFSSVALLVGPLLAWASFLAAVHFWSYPDGVAAPPRVSTILLDRAGAPLAMFAASDGQWRMPLEREQINPHLLHAIVAVEDSRFEEHQGIDWKSAVGAALADLRRLHIRRGASTLTMQLHRLREPRRRTFWNKIEQAIRARQIERTQSKQQILVGYLNRAPFGGNLVGAGAASWRYFGRPCSNLSLAESALLAGLPQAPNRLRPDRYPDRAKSRRDHVLARMLACAMIDQKRFDEAIAEPVNAAWHALPQDEVSGSQSFGTKKPHGQEYQPMPRNSSPASGALPMLLRLASTHPGQTVLTTIDSSIQQQAFGLAEQHLMKVQSAGVNAIAVVVLDTASANCLAAVSISDGAKDLDLTVCPRSTGSTLKPFIYAAAFEAGVCTPQTVLDDSPAAWAGYAPADYDHKFRGQVTAAEALADSRNIPAMRVLADVGVQHAVGVMEAAGFKTLARSPRNYGLSLAIGGANATPMELAQAYATLARGGIVRDARLIEETRDYSLPRYSGGGLGWGFGAESQSSQIQAPQNKPPPQPSPGVPGEGEKGVPSESHGDTLHCLDQSACWQTLTAISGVERTASVCPEAARTFVAWKTGTSSGHRDAWCAAVTRNRTVVVWMGNIDDEGSVALVGQESAAPLALQLIAELDQGSNQPWPLVPSRPEEATAHLTRPPSEHLTILSPHPGEQFVLSDDLPPAKQRVMLRATTSSSDAPQIWWFVDQSPVGTCPAGQSLAWPPTAGSHTIRAVDETGKAATVQIVVR
jgi:penicillin-binding protein 1C